MLVLTDLRSTCTGATWYCRLIGEVDVPLHYTRLLVPQVPRHHC